MMPYEKFFENLTSFQPYGYQERVAAMIRNGKNLVLRAPTGTGKTWTVIAPFFYSCFANCRLADRLLYALPLRTLASSIYNETRVKTNQSQLFTDAPLDIQIQTGEKKDAPFFDADLVFTTIDQLLSSYLLNPLSLPRRVGNINAGALLGSLIVFDEYHLLEPDKSMATSIEMLNRLNHDAQVAQFVLMTATLSSGTAKWLGRELNADVVELDRDEVASLHSQKDKHRCYRWVPDSLRAPNVINQHRHGKRTIVLVNTVQRAQQIFHELTSDQSRQRFGNSTQFALLHSRFYPKDRQEVENKLSQWFGTNADVEDVVLVTTQVIEAGMDLSCSNLHTELAPMNALVQRAGRCARRQGERGTVWVYELEIDDNEKRRLGPYRALRSVVDETAAVLSEDVTAEGRELVYHDELDFVNRVHTDQELATLRQYESLRDLRSRIHGAMDGNNSEAVRELVRDVDSVNVIVTSDPDELRFDRRKWPLMLSVSTSALWTLSEAIKNPSSAPWVLQTIDEADDSQMGVLEFKWRTITDPNELRAVGWLVAVHPNWAAYDTEFGLRLGVPGEEVSVQYRDRPQAPRYPYRLESYEEHVSRVLQAAERHADQYRVTSSRLALLYETTPEEVERWVRIACALHDVGKLSREWQEVIWRWQDHKDKLQGRSPRDHFPIAHSDYDPETDWKEQKRPEFSRPPHAAEGAYAVEKMLCELLPAEIAPVVYSAIARHHGTWTRQLRKFVLPPDATSHVHRTLERAGLLVSVPLCNQPSELDCKEFGDDLLKFSDLDDVESWAAYVYLCRRLRLADQASTKDENE